MQNNKFTYAAVGAFVLCGLAALLYLGLRASDLSGFRAKDAYQLTAMFNDISGLSKNAKVTMSGVQVGRVTDIRYDPEFYQARVTLQISGEYKALPSDTSAEILTAGLLGEKYIGLTPGGDDVPLKDGGQIQFTSSSVVLEKLIQQVISNMTMGQGEKG
ncbi:MAG: outer membrane lipid asymmetry maintenance protein MlaD [Cardiobacteriaceae bacterium]|nr:outer membrane lipid asymmetry maintenance protein MlaD [Cardiobacteriaceae bacterium]